VGLTFLEMGVGGIIDVTSIGATGGRTFKHLSKQYGVEKPESRLPIMVSVALFVPIGLFWYGWSAQAHTYFLVPIIGTALVAFGMVSEIICCLPLSPFPLALYPTRIILIGSMNSYQFGVIL
jgi:hypothetical protein